MAPLVVLRCDGDALIGAGHVGRCLPVARALRGAGAEVCFAGTYAGIAADLLADWPRADPAGDPAGVPAGADAALVDSYAVPDAEVAALAQHMRVVAVADRAGARRAGLVLDYHLDAAGPALAGPDFAPLDPRLVAARRARRTSGRVLVALGGSAAGGEMLPRVVDAAREATGLEVAVAGPHAPPAGPRVKYLGAMAGLADAVAAADLIVCGAGVTAYEAACAGIPAVLVVHADNQLRVADAFGERGAAIFGVLDARDGLDETALRERLHSPGTGARGPQLVDGYGAFRVRDALLHGPPAVVLRYRPPRAAERERGEAPGAEQLVVERAGAPVGTAHLRRVGAECELRLSLDPGNGLAGRAMREIAELLLASRPGLRRVVSGG